MGCRHPVCRRSLRELVTPYNSRVHPVATGDIAGQPINETFLDPPNSRLRGHRHRARRAAGYSVPTGDFIVNRTIVYVMVALSAGTLLGAETPGPGSFVNSLGMKLVRIEPGTFAMGSPTGEFDERPVHEVTLTQSFLMAVTEVTNAQYEQFDVQHQRLRGHRRLSIADDEAVIMISWHEAVAFCEWLTKREGKPYRLPTEAEWEYACRAGTSTEYHTGEQLPAEYHKNQKSDWDPQPVSLTVGKSPANAWGLFDMHGNVEEWCSDWYGPYTASDQTDPVGLVSGDMRVARGGSHNTELPLLRSANRSGTLPADKNWLIGFRVVQAPLPTTEPLPRPEPPLWARDVQQTPCDWVEQPEPDRPLFARLQRFVHIPPNSNGPLYSRHNHCPAITWCSNGDLLAIWFSTNTESGREMTILASRLRLGSDRWDDAAEFFKAPDRNMTGSALYHDGHGRLFHINGMEAGDGWANLALVLRTSVDNGATWSHPRLINANHQPRNQVISGTLRTGEGFLIQACDAVYGGNGGTAIHVSRDGGETWSDPGAGNPPPDFQSDKPGGTIAGIHAGIVPLKDGRLLAFGRGDSRTDPSNGLGPRMPQSISDDLGRSWTYSASPWPPISSGQRLVLARLREGPLLFVSFTNPAGKDANGGLMFSSADGREFKGYGLFAALSYDEGTTWTTRKLLTPGSGQYDTAGHTRQFQADATHAEPRGYLACAQTPDGIIHLISSGLYYRLNLAWLKQPNEAPPASPPAKR
jgi:formylglycine-generating enzyme required for sulfatase activity